MPDVIRSPLRLNCRGLDLSHPVDRMPPDCYPYLLNARVVEEGRLDARPGYTVFGGGAPFNSIRRLNDEDNIAAPNGYIYIAGTDDGRLFAGIESALTQIDTGYSGNPLSLLTFRPEQSPESWMYVYDAINQVKVNPGKVVRLVGVRPPGAVVTADYAQPATVDLEFGSSATGWTLTSSAGSAPATQNRESSGAAAIVSIVYNSGTTGWCCINPSTTGDFAWAGERMEVNVGAEECVVREIHPAISATTVSAVEYDSGVNGLCSIALASSPSGLDHNSLLNIGGEVVRVLAVVLSPDGSTYSIRCATTGSHGVGSAVTGLVSWYVYTTVTHSAGEAITSNFIYEAVGASSGATTVVTVTKLIAIDASHANNRPVSLSDDYLHISFYCNNPQNIIAINLRIDLDADTSSTSNAFTRNYITWTISPNQINNSQQVTPPPLGVWTELVIPLSDGVRSGGDDTRTLANIMALQVEVDMTSDLCTYGFASWYLFGTYGPDVLNSPAGIVYACRFREGDTGAVSTPGPPTRWQLFPRREGIVVTCPVSVFAGITLTDIYRQGGTVSQLTYVGTVPNMAGNSYTDSLTDASVDVNPAADFTKIQPWPVLDLAWSGTCNVSGTWVTALPGSTPFDINLLSGQIIVINGTAYQVYGQPADTTHLEIFASGGAQTGVAFQVPGPTLMAQYLPLVFGPLEGPFAPVAFGLGDPKNPGTLYYTNPGDLDSASDQNTLELCSPGEPLITGEVWQGLVIAGSRENLYLVRYSYLNTLGQAGPTTFQFSRMPVPTGFWSRWSICRGPDGIYFLGRDGIYRVNEAGAEIVGRFPDGADPLYPLFPHDGQAAAGTSGVDPVFPVDMTQLASLRLSCCDYDIYFDYIPTRTS